MRGGRRPNFLKHPRANCRGCEAPPGGPGAVFREDSRCSTCSAARLPPPHARGGAVPEPPIQRIEQLLIRVLPEERQELEAFPPSPLQGDVDVRMHVFAQRAARLTSAHRKFRRRLRSLRRDGFLSDGVVPVRAPGQERLAALDPSAHGLPGRGLHPHQSGAPQACPCSPNIHAFHPSLAFGRDAVLTVLRSRLRRCARPVHHRSSLTRCTGLAGRLRLEDGRLSISTGLHGRRESSTSGCIDRSAAGRCGRPGRGPAALACASDLFRAFESGRQLT